jgi:hypothetical protein
MKTTLTSFQRPDGSQIGKIWKDGTIAFDTSVLLNLYAWPRSGRQEVFDYMRQLNIWLPHQVVLEFYRNRRRVAEREQEEYNQALDAIKKTGKSLESLTDLVNKHSGDDKLQRKLKDQAKGLLDEYKTALQKSKPVFGDESSDSVLTALLKLFDGRVGAPFSPEELTTMRTEAALRHQFKIPPGYNDEGRHGDVFVWLQLLARAKETRNGVILVTEDGQSEKKSDWWQKDGGGKKIGPRTELMAEMRQQTGQQFWMYDLKAFVEKAGQFLKAKPATNAAAAIEATRRISEMKLVSPLLFSAVLDSLPNLSLADLNPLQALQLNYRSLYDSEAIQRAMRAMNDPKLIEAVRRASEAQDALTRSVDVTDYMRTLRLLSGTLSGLPGSGGDDKKGSDRQGPSGDDTVGKTDKPDPAGGKSK